MQTSTTVALGLSLGALYLIQRVIEYRRAVASLGHLPGIRQFFSPTSLLVNAVGRLREKPLPAIVAGFGEFEKAGWDALSLVTVFPSLFVLVDVADPAAVKEIVTHRSRFPKPVEFYDVLKFFGMNVVVTEGAEWKKHRKVAAPAFTEKNYRMVWDETARIMQDLLHNEWKRAKEVKVENGIDITVPITLYIIASAGFGQRISWEDEKDVPQGYRMTFKESIHVVSTKVFYKLLFPRWAMGITASLSHLRDAFDDFDKYMLQMIETRRSKESKEERSDLFTNLLKATEADSDAKLTDRELAGNIFVFLLAGHETTAHTLCFCLAFLALYPHEQERLYEEIKAVLPGPDSIPVYEDMGRLPYAMACFYETLRLMPPVLGIPKMSAEDQSLTVSNQEGEKRQIPLPKGTYVSISTVGMHQNPRFWSEPKEFKPERFLGDWPRDAFMPFSGGARSCIGRRFSETEAVVILAMLLSHYHVSVTEESRFAHETFEQRKARVLASKPGITTTPVRTPLTFTRRY